MFSLHPDVALMLTRERIAEDHRKADQHRRVAEARRAQRSLRTSTARRLVDNTPLMSDAEIRIAHAEPPHHNATLAVLRKLSRSALLLNRPMWSDNRALRKLR